jgi:hypothetical protein
LGGVIKNPHPNPSLNRDSMSSRANLASGERSEGSRPIHDEIRQGSFSPLLPFSYSPFHGLCAALSGLDVVGCLFTQGAALCCYVSPFQGLKPTILKYMDVPCGPYPRRGSTNNSPGSRSTRGKRVRSFISAAQQNPLTAVRSSQRNGH